MQDYRLIGVVPVCQTDECGGGDDGGDDGGGDGGDTIYVPPSFQWRFFHTDHLGTSRIVTDAAGAVVSEHHYLPFGEEVPPSDHNGVTNLSNNSHRFTGHERDAETGLDYMVARYYSAPLGRFLAVDPSPESIIKENPQTWNRYTYALNNPLRHVDPDGMAPRNAEAKNQVERLKKKGNKCQKEDAEGSEKDTSPPFDVELEAKAAFTTTQPDGTKNVETFDTGNAKGKRAADAKNEEAKQDPSIVPRTGQHDSQADGSIKIVVYEGSRQYSGRDAGKSKAEYVMTVVGHELAEMNGRSHEEAMEREVCE